MSDPDHISDHILRVLQQDGRISNLDLAAKVGLSPSACLRRVQELERRGVIAGYRAVISAEAREVGFVAYVMIGLSHHSIDAQLGFERICRTAAQVRECHNITGTVEYLLRVECRDLAAYKQFHTDVLGGFAHIATIATHVVMSSPKDDRA
ncbi:Lrp/AsnC family transcriptional regulator [Paracoccus sp. M683]|uniref:Lrp/AsnC family transcriptional regulator n=1 Tax=Paracoccus sp. M683 TaxID=2594268 RepID=UPI00117D808C|nr:Lrp/AsnC family transcriptional regulator [Paracoccus sp. M683]TRW96834.1 Lrp/AsnC family transcriptional regulator [Paracoccus sp. M683]